MHTATENRPELNKAAMSPPSGEKKKATIQKIQSRFGEIEVDTATTITFKHGLLGIPEATSFCLADLPHIKTDQFKMLQCLQDEGLSFVVVPSQYDNQLIKSADLDEACKVLELKKESLVVFFILTVHENIGDRHLSVNAKAPILVDSVNKAATQYVFQNSQYAIQHRIS